MTVYIGTAGFSYKDWKGNFYPRDIKPAAMLTEYARQFPVVEINSTYYAVPPPQRMDSMARRTPAGFLFTVKANREMTHEIGEGDDVFDRFTRALRPLVDHGKLGCVLAQFPWGFKNTKENRRYLQVLSGRLEGIETVVEFRNAGWEKDETYELLSQLELAYCCVDEPRMKGLVSPRVEVTSRLGYIRFHGRNYETWWGRDRKSWERYNYLYKQEELAEWVPRVEEVAEGSDRTYVIFNNHYKGQAPTNARMFERMLRGVLGDRLDNTGWEDPGSGQLFE